MCRMIFWANAFEVVIAVPEETLTFSAEPPINLVLVIFQDGGVRSTQARPGSDVIIAGFGTEALGLDAVIEQYKAVLAAAPVCLVLRIFRSTVDERIDTIMLRVDLMLGCRLRYLAHAFECRVAVPEKRLTF